MRRAGARGHIARWGGRFGTLDASTGVFRAKSENDAKAGDDFFRLLSADEVYVGVPTMRGLCDGLRELIPENAAVDSPQCAVTRLERARDEDADENATPWVVSIGRALDVGARGSRERHLGEFRAVVAADVMLAKTGTPAFDCSLRRRSASATGGGFRRSSRWSGIGARHAARRPPSRSSRSMVAYPIDAFDAAPFSFDAAIITGSPDVRLLVRDGAKPGRGTNTRTTRNRWTAVSTVHFRGAGRRPTRR